MTRESKERWITVGEAPDQLTAEMWCEYLQEQGIPARLSPGQVTSFLGVSALATGVQVPESAGDAAVEALEALEADWESEDGDEDEAF